MSSGLLTPPGYRHVMATIARGSWSFASSSCSRRRVRRNSDVVRLRYSTYFSSSMLIATSPPRCRRCRSLGFQFAVDEVEDVVRRRLIEVVVADRVGAAVVEP